MPRSWLVVPSADADALVAASVSGADAVVVDLAAVPPDGKQSARAAAARWAAESGSVSRWVRLSAGDALEDDVQELCREAPGLAGVIVPQAANGALLIELDHIFGSRPIALAAMVESAVGMLNAGALAAVSRLAYLVLGEDAIITDLGVDPSDDGREMASVRGHLVVVSAAFGKLPPIGAPPRVDASPAEVQASSDALRRAGYGGRLVAEPAQVGVVNEVFTVDLEAAAAAERLVVLHEKALADGEIAVDDRGLPIAEPDLRAAYRLLARVR
jgi:citrate lyase beta subunit